MDVKMQYIPQQILKTSPETMEEEQKKKIEKKKNKRSTKRFDTWYSILQRQTGQLYKTSV